MTRLREEGFRPYWHQRIPPNDGGIALGQVFAAARMASLQTVARRAWIIYPTRKPPGLQSRE